MDYTILMKPEVWDLFWTYTRLMPGEVGCFGYATVDAKNQEIIVDEIFLVPQESDASQVDFVKDGLPYAIEKALKDGRLDDLRFCIHSHGHFGANWSSTDEDMIKKMGLTADWFVSVIFNKKGEKAGRIDTWQLPPFGRCQVTIKDVPVEMLTSHEYEDECIADLEKFVKKPAPKAPVKSTSSSGSSSSSTGSANGKITPEMVREAVREALREATAEKEREEFTDITGGLSMEELAEELGWESFVANGLRYYVDDKGEIQHMEPISDDVFDHLPDQESLSQAIQEGAL